MKTFRPTPIARRTILAGVPALIAAATVIQPATAQAKRRTPECVADLLGAS